MRSLRSIQVLRGVAACFVAVGHASGGVAPGATWVDLFFVISGFIMAGVSRGRTPGQFLFDRFWRIYPLWWIAIIPWLASSRDWQIVATSLTLWPLWGALVRPALPVGWTLLFEILFYVSVALSMRFGIKPVLAVFALFLAGGVAYRSQPVFSYFGNPMMLEYLAGVLIYNLPKSSRIAVPLLVVATVLLMLSPSWVYAPSFAMSAPRSAWRVLYWGIPSAMIVYACISLEQLFQSRRWNVPVLLGDASYSIYLFHLFIMGLLPFAWPIKSFIMIGACVAIWAFFERPIMAMKPRLWRTRKPVEAMASTP